MPRRLAVAACTAALGAVVVAACGSKQAAGPPHPGPTPSARSASPAAVTTPTEAPLRPGATRLSFRFGPIEVKPGQNNIRFAGFQVPKPAGDGWIVGITPNLRRADGSVPAVDVIHLHHGVWLNLAHRDPTSPALPERFFAVGEEKTGLALPDGFGYRYRASDPWAISYMIHDLYPTPDQVWITYDIDFVPAGSPAAGGIRDAHPVWMDVQNGKGYPVFDALQGSGSGGVLTYPDGIPNAYRGRPALNEWAVKQDGVLIATGGHLHPGGLYDELSLRRAGAGATPGSAAASAVVGDTATLFRSDADYFEPAGAVSWDVAMKTTPPGWRVAVHPGDVLRITAAYDTSRASWYEAMGIMVLWMADGTDGANPFAQRVDVPGVLNHGHLPENNNHGRRPGALADPATLAVGPAVTGETVSDFTYQEGDYSDGPTTVPTVKQGQPLSFTNLDAPIGPGIWHTITACRAPCNASTGIAFPLADAAIAFDSGELGAAGPPTSGHTTWSTPATLPPGLYTYFCRIHPFMRGAFKVVPAT